jgi:hypothetical protein
MRIHESEAPDKGGGLESMSDRLLGTPENLLWHDWNKKIVPYRMLNNFSILTRQAPAHQDSPCPNQERS